MQTRSGWKRSITAVIGVAAITVGSLVSLAHADPKKQKGVPPGQPFQALLWQIEQLGARLETLEALAPQAGVVWVNPLDVKAATAASSLDPAAAGLVLTAAGAGNDVAQTVLEVPYGYALTWVTVCYVSGATGSSINAVEVAELAVPPTVPPTTTVLASNAPAPPPAGSSSCVGVETTVAVNPSASGPLFLSLGITFTAAEAVTISAIGVGVEPVAAP